MSALIMSKLNNAMQELTDLVYATSEEHIDSTESRITIDVSDVVKMKENLINVHLLTWTFLMNIVKGVDAKEEVNVH